MAQVADDGLERVLTCSLSALSECTLLMLSSQVEAGAPEAEVVIASQNQHVVGQLAASGAGHCLLFALLGGVTVHLTRVLTRTVSLEHLWSWRGPCSVALRLWKDVVVHELYLKLFTGWRAKFSKKRIIEPATSIEFGIMNNQQNINLF